MIELKKPLSEAELIEKAQKSGVGVYPTKKFWNRPDQRAYSSVILGFGGIEEDDIVPAVKALYSAWET